MMLQSGRRGSSGSVRLLVALMLLTGTVAGVVVLAQRNGWISEQESWLTIPDAIRSRPEVRVAAVTVERGRSADAVVVATGYLESRRQARIGARTPGRIEVVHVEEGSRVTKDELLAVLEHADLDASLAAVRATHERTKAELGEQDVEIERTRKDFERAKKLRAARSMTESDYDTARFAHEAAVARRMSLQAAAELAAARIREAEQLLENMSIRAPFDGTVISKDAEVGESILPGGMGDASGRGSVVTIADLDHLEVDCDVKEDYISRVIEGRPAEVAVDAVPNRRYKGRVRKIIPMGDRARATVKVKVEILDADERLFPDMSSTVYFLPDQDADTAQNDEPRIFCPSDAVISRDDRTWVWLVDKDDRVSRRDVTAGETRDRRTEILDGLSGGEKVIVDPSDEARRRPSGEDGKVKRHATCNLQTKHQKPVAPFLCVTRAIRLANAVRVAGATD